MLDKVRFTNICRDNKYNVNSIQIELLDKYVQQLLEWNDKINLFSRKDTKNIWMKHILSSIAILFNHKFMSGSHIMDVGTGGGLPGIPLAILNQDSNFILIDSIQKKIKAVDNVIKYLGLQNVQTRRGRAEEFARKKEYIRHYDFVVARAVASITEMIRWCKPFLRESITKKDLQVQANSNRKLIKSGSIILLKGGNIEGEIAEAKVKINPKELEIFPIAIKGIDSTELFDKKLVIIQT